MNTLFNAILCFVGLFFVSRTKTKAGELATSILDASGNVIDYVTDVIKDATEPSKSAKTSKWIQRRELFSPSSFFFFISTIRHSS